MPSEDISSSSTNQKFSKPIWFRIKGTVILKIWIELLFMTIYTTVLVVLHVHVPEFKIDFSSSLIGLLGLVLGLLLAFRTNTAYGLYTQGRNLWDKMTTNVRHLCMCIWIGVKENDGKDVVGKITIMNLLLAYAIAMKHHLREEYSTEYDDIKDLIISLPISTTSLTQNNKRNKSMKYTAHALPIPCNIPLELLYYIQTYMCSITSNGQLQQSLVFPVMGAVGQLINCLTEFEKVLSTPVPLVYSVHLHHILWIYILALPFQLIKTLSWWTIPVVALTTFSFLGILAICGEIINPFGYDDNDLPLDDYCKELRREIQLISWNKLPPVDDWLLSNKNCPLKPSCTFNAQELSTQSVEQIHQILFQRNIALRQEFKINPSTSMFSWTLSRSGLNPAFNP